MELRTVQAQRLGRVVVVAVGRRWLLLFLIIAFFAPTTGEETTTTTTVPSGSSSLFCTDHEECEIMVGTGSKCVEFWCTEFVPFYNGGCLYQRLEGWDKKRVCNSEDPPEAAELGICRNADFDYMEIRIATQNWESVFFEAYLLQILLSELLDVPTTLETGTPDAKLNFYDPEMPFDYGIANDWDGFDRAAEIVDCTAANRHGEDSDSYESCYHMVPENWDSSNAWVKERVQEESIEFPLGLGILGQESWFMPKFTIRRQPSLSTYMGLQGEENRRKLADTFLRPTKWEDYCNEVSPNRCAAPDGVAQRAPDDEEGGLYFAANNLYTGYFRKTDRNDCDKYPANCTGHIVDYPCGWSGYVEQIATHLGIALESNGDEPGSGGYTYSEMVQILLASNATQSDIAIQWWTPEASYSRLLGTAAELQRVALPPPTDECIRARVGLDDRCSENVTVRVGSPEGVCDEAAHPLQKLISSALYGTVYDPSIPEGSRSPGYDAIKLFSITNVQMDAIYDYWFERQSRGAGQSAREAVCDWVVDNMDYLREFVPRTYPRVLWEEKWNALLVASASVAAVATCTVIWTAWSVFRQRHRRVIRFAQIEFLWLLLAGLLTLSLGAIFTVFATDVTCMAAMWFVNFGYTLGFVPLLVKVTAINRLMNAANSMRRVVVQRRSLFGAVIAINGLVAVLLAFWSAMDAPVRTPEYDLLVDSVTERGETVVSVSYYCSSQKSKMWRYMVVSVNAALLLWATVLAFQTHRLRQEFNESLTLAIMIYSRAVFLVLRLITFFLQGSGLSNSVLAHSQSIIYSLDTIATVVIYFVPKFVTADRERQDTLKGYHVYLQRLVTKGPSQFSTAEHGGTAENSDLWFGAEHSNIDETDCPVVVGEEEEEENNDPPPPPRLRKSTIEKCRISIGTSTRGYGRESNRLLWRHDQAFSLSVRRRPIKRRRSF